MALYVCEINGSVGAKQLAFVQQSVTSQPLRIECISSSAMTQLD